MHRMHGIKDSSLAGVLLLAKLRSRLVPVCILKSRATTEAPEEILLKRALPAWRQRPSAIDLKPAAQGRCVAAFADASGHGRGA